MPIRYETNLRFKNVILLQRVDCEMTDRSPPSLEERPEMTMFWKMGKTLSTNEITKNEKRKIMMGTISFKQLRSDLL